MVWVVWVGNGWWGLMLCGWLLLVVGDGEWWWWRVWWANQGPKGEWWVLVGVGGGRWAYRRSPKTASSDAEVAQYGFGPQPVSQSTTPQKMLALAQ